jgi:hypothetical protein
VKENIKCSRQSLIGSFGGNSEDQHADGMRIIKDVFMRLQMEMRILLGSGLEVKDIKL